LCRCREFDPLIKESLRLIVKDLRLAMLTLVDNQWPNGAGEGFARSGSCAEAAASEQAEGIHAGGKRKAPGFGSAPKVYPSA
jgi:hypothetical protein